MAAGGGTRLRVVQTQDALDAAKCSWCNQRTERHLRAAPGRDRGQGGMNALLERAARQLRSVREDVERIQTLLGAAEGSGSAVRAVQGEISAGLATAVLTVQSAEEALSRETCMEKRQSYKQYVAGLCAHALKTSRRVLELKGEHQGLREALERIKAQVREGERSAARAQLLAAPSTVERAATTATVTAAALEEREESTVRYAETRLGEYISIGGSTLDALKVQRQTLKSAQRRVLDAGTRLGLGQSLMRIISRRTAQDRYIFYTGVVGTFLAIYFCWRYIA